MINAVETSGLSKRYGRRRWALRGCDVTLPQGSIVALVGPNGAGKTTLLHLAIGLLTPTAGTVSMFGEPLRMNQPAGLQQIGFVAQDHPLYRSFSVEDLLRWGRSLNPRWDQRSAEQRLDELGIPLRRKAGKLSGGQQAQVALTLALAKRPSLLVLDEPVASLDPLGRREFMRALVTAVSKGELTVVLSSHVVAELERVCDHLILLRDGRVRIQGPIDDLLRAHRSVVAPPSVTRVVDPNVIAATPRTAHTDLVVRVDGPGAVDPAWASHPVTLEALVLAYLEQIEAPVTEPTSDRSEG